MPFKKILRSNAQAERPDSREVSELEVMIIEVLSLVRVNCTPMACRIYYSAPYLLKKEEKTEFTYKIEGFFLQEMIDGKEERDYYRTEKNL